MTRLNLIFILLACIMCGCRTQYVPVETVKTDYKDRIQEIHTVDSVSNDRIVYIKGDTIYISQKQDRWRTRTVHDSIYINRTDTVMVPYPEERKPTAWENAKMSIGAWTAAIAGAAIIILAMKWLRGRFRK